MRLCLVSTCPCPLVRVRGVRVLRFCLCEAQPFRMMFTELGRGPKPAPLFVLRRVHTGAHPAPNRERRNGSGSKREQHCYRLSRLAWAANRRRFRRA